MTMRDTIEAKLQAALAPGYLEEIDESANHSRGRETHFKVTLAADAFQGQRLLQRHRQVNAAVAQELSSSVHALAIHTFSMSEWRERGGQVSASPECAHGSS